uniref:Ovule protein n=1 Tax=Angiostrongylus cantonensis TaxID=6313 RepID=A0A0K0DCB8_ANGCA
LKRWTPSQLGRSYRGVNLPAVHRSGKALKGGSFYAVIIFCFLSTLSFSKLEVKKVQFFMKHFTLKSSCYPLSLQSRSADKYEIKRLLRKLVNKVEQLERKERQQKRKASNETKTATPEAEPKLEHYTNSEVTPESIDAKPTSKSIEADVVTNTKKSSESTKRADANQNIIKLVEEKVLQIQMS